MKSGNTQWNSAIFTLLAALDGNSNNFGIYFILHGNLLSGNWWGASGLRRHTPKIDNCHAWYLLSVEWISWPVKAFCPRRIGHDWQEPNSSCPSSGMRYRVSWAYLPSCVIGVWGVPQRIIAVKRRCLLRYLFSHYYYGEHPAFSQTYKNMIFSVQLDIAKQKQYNINDRSFCCRRKGKSIANY